MLGIENHRPQEIGKDSNALLLRPWWRNRILSSATPPAPLWPEERHCRLLPETIVTTQANSPKAMREATSEDGCSCFEKCFDKY